LARNTAALFEPGNVGLWGFEPRGQFSLRQARRCPCGKDRRAKLRGAAAVTSFGAGGACLG